MRTQKRLKLLIIGDRARLLARLLEAHQVDVIDDLNSEREELLSTYDLLLIGADVWKGNRTAADAAKRFQFVIVFDDPPGSELWPNIKPAIGWISAKWSQSAIVAELYRFWRYPNSPTINFRILIVNNRIPGQSVHDSLKQQGCFVRIASNLQDAQAALESFEPHVVVTEKSLSPIDSWNSDGLRLFDEIKEKYADVIKVVLLITREFFLPEETPRAAGAKVVWVAGDKTEPDELEQKIKDSIVELGLNLSIDITNADWKKIAQLVPGDQTCSETTIQSRLTDIVAKLFKNKDRVETLHELDSEGGSGALLMSPVEERESARQFFLVRFGDHELIKSEQIKHRRFLGSEFRGPTLQRPETVETMRWSGLKFGFSSNLEGPPRCFADFYRESDEDKIEEALGRFFTKHCRRWYERPETLETHQVMRHYLRPCEDSNYRKRLETEIEKIVNEPYEGLVIRQEKQDVNSRFKATVPSSHGKFETHWLDNPLAFLDGLQKLDHPAAFLKGLKKRGVLLSENGCFTNATLSGRNILVDGAGNFCLTDFYNTKIGSSVRDFSYLEAIVKFELICDQNLSTLYHIEKTLIKPDRFDYQIPDNRYWSGVNLLKARRTIWKIRELAKEETHLESINEFYLWLMLHALRMLVWKGVSESECRTATRNTRKRYALLSAAMIANRLQGKPIDDRVTLVST